MLHDRQVARQPRAELGGRWLQRVPHGGDRRPAEPGAPAVLDDARQRFPHLLRPAAVAGGPDDPVAARRRRPPVRGVRPDPDVAPPLQAGQVVVGDGLLLFGRQGREGFDEVGVEIQVAAVGSGLPAKLTTRLSG